MRRIAIGRILISAAILSAMLLANGPAAKAAQEKRHQATGTVATSNSTQLVLLKKFGRNQAHWNFVLNPKTKIEGKLTKGERIRIYYYADAKGQRVAEQIKMLTAASPAAPKPAPATAPPASPAPPQPGH